MNGQDERRDAYAGFLAMAADGTLGSLDEAEASALASSISDEPILQEAVLDRFYGSKMGTEIEDEARERDMTWRRMKSDRRTAMFRAAGVGASEAGRIAFDEMAGDPSAMLKVKERFFFG